MIYSFTSVKEVIAKVYRDLNFQDAERWVDLVEWCGEALEAIQAPQQLEDRYCKLTIKDYKVKLPCNFHKLNYIYFNGFPLLPSTSVFGNTLINHTPKVVDTITLDKLNGNPILLDIRNTQCPTEWTYTIDPCYIKTNFKDGDIYIAYSALRVDEDGFPEIPDDISYKQACFWYCAKQLLLPDWFENKSTRYEAAEAKWQWYCGQAGAKAMAPDLPTLENIKNMWVRLLPEINRGSTFFTTLSRQERLDI